MFGFGVLRSRAAGLDADYKLFRFLNGSVAFDWLGVVRLRLLGFHHF